MATQTATTLPNPATATPGLPATGMPGMPAATPALPGAGLALPQVGTFASLSSLQGVFSQPAVRRALPALGVIILLVLIGVIYASTQQQPYRPVFPGMAEADQQAALETLKGANFKPIVDPSTGHLSVPANRYHEARILLASQGLPRTQGKGVLDTLKDQSAMTTSQFMEQARYSAAIEQELGKSITQIATIQNARVHLAQTKQSPFVRERTPAKASVVITPYGGRVVSPAQVQAIVHLVASSVPYLSAEDVSVIDNHGNLMTKSPADAAMGLTGVQLQLKQQAEDSYRARIVQLLEPVVGEGNVRSQVDLTMNFAQVETTSEDYDSKRNGPTTRSEALSEERSSSTDPLGIPGALSNTPPPDAESTTASAATNEKKDGKGTVSAKTTRNYEIDKTVRHVKQAMGGVDRLTVAVVIKERAPAKDAKPGEPTQTGYTPEEIERLTNVVKGAVGFNEERGDVVTIMPAKFEPMSTGPQVPWYENEAVMGGIKIGIAALVLVVVLLAVVRPVLRAYLPEPVKPAAEPAQLPAPETAEAAAAAAAATAAADGTTPATDGAEGAVATAEATDAAVTAEAAAVAAVPTADGAGLTMEEGETLDDFKERLKKSAAPKKTTISADMLDTANTYDDKVALVRLLVAEDAGRVATVLKNMIQRDMSAA